MKYEIHVNQKAILDNGFDLDLIDGAILGSDSPYFVHQPIAYVFQP